MFLNSCVLLSACIILLVAMPVAGDFQAGMEAYDRGDFAVARREFRPLAEQGHFAAQWWLGVMDRSEEFLNGYRKAAEQGDPDAQWSLGVFYGWNERGVPQQDYVEAVKWFRKAAEQGHAKAQFSLGRMYAEGKGVPQDDVKARKWYRKAAEQGHEGAQDALKGEIWRCFATSDHNRKTALFTLTRKRAGNRDYGWVTVANAAHVASFRIAGLNRRWDFGDDESGDSYPYAFIIKPDGTGLYYDFSTSSDGTANARDSFNCLMSPFLIWGGLGEPK